jgi:hypothetical protein
MAGTAVFRIVVSSASMKNATATSHGKRLLLEADGAAGIEGELLELTGLAMESKNYFTNECKDLLEFARDSAKPSVRRLGLLPLGRLVRPTRNPLYKRTSRGLFLRPFLATIKRT